MRIPVLALLAGMSLSAFAIEYPITPATDARDDYFGEEIHDPYRWLEDLDASRTRDWIEEQNGVTLPFLAALPERDGIAKRLGELWDVTVTDAPLQAGGRWFFTRRVAGQNQPVLMVTESLDDPARVLLDPNTLSDDGTVALAEWKPSPDGRWLLWASAAAGSDWNRFQVRNVLTGHDLPERLERIKFSEMAWTDDSSAFVYSRYPDRPTAGSGGLNDTVFDELANQQVYLHRLRTPQSADQRLFAQPQEPSWFIRATITDSGRYALYTVQQGSADENKLAIADLGSGATPDFSVEPHWLVENFDASFEPIGEVDGRLYLVTNQGADHRKVIALDLAKAGLAQAVEVVPESADTIQDARLVKGELIIVRMADAKSRIERYGLDGTPRGEIALDGIGAVSDLHGSPDSPLLSFRYESFNRPRTAYTVDLSAPEPKAVAFAAPTLAFDPDRFVTEQVFYKSKDGTRVPMFISHLREVTADRKQPRAVFLHGYGGFDIPKLPAYDASALAWMEMGGVYAVANLRGGGEYGREWHLAGTRERKQNVFDDFYYAARSLVAEDWTEPEHIAIWGRSNGGLLVGASVNQHPEYWGAAVATVGVMDMLRYQKFTVGYAWAGDYGTSDTEDGFDYLIKYSPLHTVKSRTSYPPVLITTGDHDDRVHPSHSYKYAATLQKAQGGPNPILIRIDRDAGHGGGKPTAKLVAEEADKLAFMWHYVKVDTPQ